MKARIEEERKRLKDEKNMKEEERKRVYEEVMKQEKELSAAQAEHNAVRTKLAALERKIIVGGIILSKLQPMKYLIKFLINIELTHNPTLLKILCCFRGKSIRKSRRTGKTS